MGALRLCFHECAAGIFVDPLQKIISRESSYDWRKIVLNINMISIVIGVVLFFTRIHLPQLINDTIGSVGSMIGPASMIVTGMLFAGMDLKKVLPTEGCILLPFSGCFWFR